MTKVLTCAELAKLCASVEKTIRESVQAPRTCLTCDSFREDLEQCQHPQHAGVRPPVRIIAYGCILHMNMDDDIPFD
jgi:hypothetical protein